MAKKFNLSGGLLNSASVKAKSNKPELILLSLSDIIENEKNFYSTEGIEELAFSIMQAGLKQPLSVIPIENGKYKEFKTFDKTKIFFKDISDDEIDKWIKTGKALDRAGGYGIQDEFAVFVEKIEGKKFFLKNNIVVHINVQ